jgi:hypothetical protein
MCPSQPSPTPLTSIAPATISALGFFLFQGLFSFIHVPNFTTNGKTLFRVGFE